MDQPEEREQEMSYSGSPYAPPDLGQPLPEFDEPVTFYEVLARAEEVDRQDSYARSHQFPQSNALSTENVSSIMGHTPDDRELA